MPGIDILVYQSLYLKDRNIVLIFRIVTLIFCNISFIGTYVCATLYNSAHAPYNRLNTLAAKYKMSADLKRKLAFYIERFSGAPITNYCLNLFALTPYEHYLFVAAVAKNFFLIVSLIEDYFVLN